MVCLPRALELRVGQGNGFFHHAIHVRETYPPRFGTPVEEYPSDELYEEGDAPGIPMDASHCLMCISENAAHWDHEEAFRVFFLQRFQHDLRQFVEIYFCGQFLGQPLD